MIFQILTQQYLHASFLLSGRSSYYLINTASMIAANVILCYVLIGEYGTVGAAWARLGADVLGFVCALVLSRRAFLIPIPLRRLALIVIAALIMALIVAALDRHLHLSDPAACAVLAFAGARQLRRAVLAAGHLPYSRTAEAIGLSLFKSKCVNEDVG